MFEVRTEEEYWRFFGGDIEAANTRDVTDNKAMQARFKRERQ